MDTAVDYLEKTRSSVEHLIAGIRGYVDVLREAEWPMFVSSVDSANEEALQQEAERWYQEHRRALTERAEIERRYFTESFAQANLCGALLQVAYMGISRHGPPQDGIEIDGQQITGRYERFCTGRAVRSIPQGLVVLAGRNQYMHLEDDQLRFPNNAIFNVLTTHNDAGTRVHYRDPALNLNNNRITCYASNITALMKWRSYEVYERDMRTMLHIEL